MAVFMRVSTSSANHYTNEMFFSLKIMAKNHLHMMMMMIMLFFCLFLTAVSSNSNVTPQDGQNDPTPKPWPVQFHSIVVLNYTKTTELQVNYLWYDWINGRNLNLIQHQLGKLVYDVEHNNGTSYYFTRGGESGKECTTIHFDVGILTPNWLQGANYLGQRHFDGFLCNVWEKVEFLWYYEDVITQRPVGWTFYTGRVAHVITFEVGAVLEDSEWQAPVYCFDKEEKGDQSFSRSDRESQQMLRESVPLPAAVM